MALSKEQWFKKLKNLVQSWVFERSVENEAIFRGMAATLEQVQLDADAHIAETFIDKATEEFVELHGDERVVERLDGEVLSAYRQRIKKIVNNSNVPAIKALVDALLIRGECTIIEHYRLGVFFYNRESFFNRNVIGFDVLYNAFTILIDFQIPDPVSFFNREHFYNREDVYGTMQSSDTVFSNVIKTVNINKAYGTVYRLIERANP